MWNLTKTKKAEFLLLLALPVFFFLSSCAVKRQTVPIDLQYVSKEAQPFVKKGAIRAIIAPFEDIRENKELVGKRIKLGGGEEYYQSKDQSVDQAVTAAVASFLEGKGFATTRSKDREVNLEDYRALSPDIVVKGKIEELWADAFGHIGYTQIKAKVKLVMVIGNVKDRSFFTITVNSISEPRVPFTSESIQRTINQALSDCIDQLLKEAYIKNGTIQWKR